MFSLAETNFVTVKDNKERNYVITPFATQFIDGMECVTWKWQSCRGDISFP